MTIGTRSLLFGAHQVFIHPMFVFIAWWRLFGFPWDPRLWVAFIIHDWGYFGKPNMDGVQGESHPILAARIMSLLFDYPGKYRALERLRGWQLIDYAEQHHRAETLGFINLGTMSEPIWIGKWGQFTMFHSRFMAKMWTPIQPSRLCSADKLALAIEPWWLYLPRVILSGEIHEYFGDRQKYIEHDGEPNDYGSASLSNYKHWFTEMASYMKGWALDHAKGKEPAKWDK